MPADDLLLDVRGLTTTFPVRSHPAAAAVDDVSFRVQRGETLGLVGESGSGKSVTALSIIQLIAPPGRIASGQVLFEGQDLLRLDDAAMQRIRGRRIGFIFQEPMVALDPVYTIGAQIEETLRAHGLATGARARRRAVELLDAVSIPDPDRRHGNYPHQLSGGLRQRAMIALALAAEPALVIADEPTTALDVTVQAEILDLLREMRRTFNLALVLITHDLGVIAEMAHRVAVMYSGHIVEEGDVAQVLRAPAHPYTRALLASIPGTHRGPRLHAIGGNVPALDQRPSGCRFAPRCAHRFEPCSAMPALYPTTTGQTARCFLHGPA
jgi:peptide/nickel transport system ATP-binding protein/oligopeptide transport system ATP-binding protein